MVLFELILERHLQAEGETLGSSRLESGGLGTRSGRELDGLVRLREPNELVQWPDPVTSIFVC